MNEEFFLWYREENRRLSKRESREISFCLLVYEICILIAHVFRVHFNHAGIVLQFIASECLGLDLKLQMYRFSKNLI